jgi:hypothetical protein
VCDAVAAFGNHRLLLTLNISNLPMSTDISLLAAASINTTNPPPLVEVDNNFLVRWAWAPRWPRIHPPVDMEIVD